MAVQVIRLFAPTVLTTSAATLYTAPAAATSPNALVSRIRVRFANTTNAPVTVTAYAIESGGTAAAGNQCVPGVSVAANAVADFDMPELGPAGFIQALASAGTSITASCLNAVLTT